MGTTGRLLSTTAALFIFLALSGPAAHAQLAELKQEVASIVDVVKDVDERKPCGEGGDFCVRTYEPHETKIKDLINQLIRKNESGEEVGWIISSWNQHAREVRRQIEHLALMRAKQESPRPVGDKCKTTGDGMLARLRAAVDKKSIDDVVAARIQAKKDGTEVARWISEQESIKGNMEQWNKNVQTFKPKHKHDGNWVRVAREMQKSSGKMLLRWAAAWHHAGKQCVEPAKGDRHQEHQALEDQFFQDMKKQLLDDLKAWRDQTKGTYKYDCDSMKKLHKTYCDEVDGDDDPEDAEVEKSFKQESEDLAKMMKEKVKARLEALAPFDARAEKLVSARNGFMGSVERFRAWKTELDDFRKEVAAERAALQKALSYGISRGFQSPQIQLWIEFGKKQHKRMEKLDEFTCALADQQFCEQRNVDAKGRETTCKRYLRPDCISVTTCRIYEFKPPGDAAKKKGWDQLNGTSTRKGYKEILESHYNKALEKYKANELNYPVVGGIKMLKEIERLCAPSGKIEFKIDDGVKQYARCEDKDGKPMEYTCAPEAE